MCAIQLDFLERARQAPAETGLGRCSDFAQKCAAAVMMNACGMRRIMNTVAFVPRSAARANRPPQCKLGTGYSLKSLPGFVPHMPSRGSRQEVARCCPAVVLS